MEYRVKRFSKKDDKERLKNVGIGVGTLIGTDAAVGGLINKGLSELNKSARRTDRDIFNNDKSNNEVFQKIKGDHSKDIHYVSRSDMEAGTGAAGDIKMNRDTLSKRIKEVKKGSPELARTMAEEVRKTYPKGKKSTIFLNNVDKGHASTLAHEMGHSLNEKTRIGKIGLKSHLVSGKIRDGLSTGGGLALGIGYGAAMKARENKTGNKESKLSKAAPAAIVGASQLPVLANETAASVRGYKILKKAGASKSLLKGARKVYAKNLGTYALGAVAPVVVVGGGQIAGHYLAKGLGKNKKKD